MAAAIAPADHFVLRSWNQRHTSRVRVLGFHAAVTSSWQTLAGTAAGVVDRRHFFLHWVSTKFEAAIDGYRARQDQRRVEAPVL